MRTAERTDSPSLHDVLSRLTYEDARKLLGSRGEALLRAGGALELAVDERLRCGRDRLEVPMPRGKVVIALDDGARRRISLRCSSCSVTPCAHLGAALALVLEEKTALGLAAPPSEAPPPETLAEEELVRQALAEREESARKERMTCKSTDPARPWTDYLVTSSRSGKTYRVALRGTERGVSYCSCPDFKKNALGTCKHLMHVLAKVERRFSAAVRRRPYRRERPCVHLHYGEEVSLRLALPDRADRATLAAAGAFAGVPITRVDRLLEAVRALERLGHDVVVYPDAEEHIAQRLQLERLARVAADIRRKPARHPLRKHLLAAELLPYQLDGIAFAVGAGRAILADDMGLGKTIQAIGVAELLAREAGIERVLVVCPASVKSQWLAEIARFSTRRAQLVLGGAAARARQYADDVFFTICNYEQVLRDLTAIERTRFDLVVLDEAHRIKNLQAKTSATVKSLRSPFALALTGTPLENRLDDLYSVIEFVDDRRLGATFRFFHRHRVVDERGKVLGYKNLDELRTRLAPVLLRRTRDMVLRELPERTTEIVRVPPTQEQLELHGTQARVVAGIVRKPFITEMDLLRLRKALLICRMVADSTYLVDKQRPSYSTKLARLDELFGDLLAESGRRIVVFSEWTTMLDEIEGLLQKRKAKFVRLDGKVPQSQRQRLVQRFQTDPECRLFLATNAGATGLNLQAADTVVNVDLPWNPAVLEQRIGRAHRMGQKRPVHVFVLVTEQTIEENMLATLSAKHELFQAVLDPDSPLDAVNLESGIEALRRRLEVLLGHPALAPLDVSAQAAAEAGAAELARRERVAQAGGKLLAAAFELLDVMLPRESDGEAEATAAARLRETLASGLERDAEGRPRLTVTLPGDEVLDRLAGSLSRLLSRAAATG